jgi:hypothetical protein
MMFDDLNWIWINLNSDIYIYIHTVRIRLRYTHPSPHGHEHTMDVSSNSSVSRPFKIHYHWFPASKGHTYILLWWTSLVSHRAPITGHPHWQLVARLRSSGWPEFGLSTLLRDAYRSHHQARNCCTAMADQWGKVTTINHH